MSKWLAAVLLAVLAGCATIDKVDKGDRDVGEKLQVVIEGPWNRMPVFGPAEVWTMEGRPIDVLLLYSGIKEGQRISQSERGSHAPAFKASMQADEIVGMFEAQLTRDGSRFVLTRLEPIEFAGQKGFRFEYALTRRSNNLQLLGLGFGAVANNELFAIVYMAPRLVFFERHRANVEQIARSARLKP